MRPLSIHARRRQLAFVPHPASWIRTKRRLKANYGTLRICGPRGKLVMLQHDKHGSDQRRSRSEMNARAVTSLADQFLYDLRIELFSQRSCLGSVRLSGTWRQQADG